MPAHRIAAVFLWVCLLPLAARSARHAPCFSADQASGQMDRDICLTAHVYDVVELPEGTRFLDVCSPGTPDEKCRFTIVSLWEDREQVGELRKYRDMDVQVRGIVRSMHGRAGIVLSHARQFNGGPPKFRPNPMLQRGFAGQQSRPPLNDPNLHAQGGRRAFMNTLDKESSPVRH
jgi:hypothetical protein